MKEKYWKVKPFTEIDKRIEIDADGHSIYVDADDVDFIEAVKLAQRISRIPMLEKIETELGEENEYN